VSSKKEKRASRFVHWVVVAVIAGVAAYLLAHGKPVNNAGPAVVLLLVAGVLLALGPDGVRDLMARLQKISLPGVASLEFAATPEAPENAKNIVDLRLTVQAQLAYIIKHLLGEFETIGSLRYDGLLSDEEAALLDRVMTLSETDFQLVKDPDDFLRNAGRLSGHFIAIVFYNHVERVLRKSGWFVTHLPTGDTFNDLLVDRPGVGPFRLAPVAWHYHFDGARERLSATKAAIPVARQRFVVVPDNDRKTSERDLDPAIVRVADLSDVLK
jgi:hypothetical protein